MIYIIIYLIGYIINYTITKGLLRESTKENYSYNDVIFNLVVSLFSWVSIAANLIMLFLIFMLRRDWESHITKTKSKPPRWL